MKLGSWMKINLRVHARKDYVLLPSSIIFRRSVVRESVWRAVKYHIHVFEVALRRIPECSSICFSPSDIVPRVVAR